MDKHCLLNNGQNHKLTRQTRDVQSVKHEQLTRSRPM